MTGKRRVRELLVEGPSSIGARARSRRWAYFHAQFPEVADMRVLDLGGTVDAWMRAPVRPNHVTVLNLLEPGRSEEAWLTAVSGDACDPPTQIRTGEFDLVFSNSLIEHVGGHARRQELARIASTLAPSYWVQTPYRFFPVEPHFLFPGLQFMPIPAQAAIVRRWPLVHTRPESHDAAMRVVQWTELVGVEQLRGYFPDGRILRERLVGLTKSLIAVKCG